MSQPRKRSPLMEMLIIAAPTVATMSSYTVMQFIDKLMVSRIQPPDPAYVAGQGNGSLASFIPISIVMGVLGVVNTFVAQNLGAGKPERGAAYGWSALWLSAFAALALLPYALIVPWLFGLDLLGHGDTLRAIESDYAQILLFGAFLTMATRGIAQFFFGLHRPMIVLVAAVIGNLVNIFANAVFIYGPAGAGPDLTGLLGEGLRPAVEAITGAAAACASTLGVPAIGVSGAAVGTIIGSAVELAFPMAVFLSRKYNRLYRTRAAWRPSAAHLKDLLKLGWPAALMFGSEMVCWGYFMVVLTGGLGRFDGDGVVHQTAGWIALQYMHLSFMPAVGLSIAVSAVVGKCMGMKRPDLAAKRAYLGLKVCMAYMGLCALAFIVFRRPMVDLFIDEQMAAPMRDQILRLGMLIMIIAGVFQLFDAMAITANAALRGAGDTIVPGVATFVLAWVCIVAGGHLMVWLAPGLGAVGPWAACAAYIICLGSFLCLRFARGRWKHIDLLGKSAGAGQATGPTGLAAAADAAGPVDGMVPSEVFASDGDLRVETGSEGPSHTARRRS